MRAMCAMRAMDATDAMDAGTSVKKSQRDAAFATTRFPSPF